MLVRMWKKGDTCALLVGMWICATTIENSMEVSQKTKKLELSYDPAIPFLCIYPKKTKH